MGALLAAFFTSLDSRGTGTITPETLSAFLDMHGFFGGGTTSVRAPILPLPSTYLS